ncbi:hypothetical protein [Galbibacter marinus]|uniref:hypothetical protein n=1 Tax=Galbibacter marinus TaxID=555500 RepID=UPI0003125988|nr:hypothetical protein [Galbibacter marinus]
MRNKLFNYVNAFLELKKSKSNYSNEQYINELEKIKSSLTEIVKDEEMITSTQEEYLQSILIANSISN